MVASLKLRPAFLSDFDDLKERRLPNWGLSARRCLRVMARGVVPGFYSEAPVHYTDDDDGVVRIDERDADNLDGFIMQIVACHRKTLCDAFYRRGPASRLDVDAAVRCLLDVLHANRAVNDKMRGRA